MDMIRERGICSRRLEQGMLLIEVKACIYIGEGYGTAVQAQTRYPLL